MYKQSHMILFNTLRLDYITILAYIVGLLTK